MWEEGEHAAVDRRAGPRAGHAGPDAGVRAPAPRGDQRAVECWLGAHAVKRLLGDI